MERKTAEQTLRAVANDGILEFMSNRDLKLIIQAMHEYGQICFEAGRKIGTVKSEINNEEDTTLTTWTFEYKNYEQFTGKELEIKNKGE